VRPAREIGRLLREHAMTAGVYQTIPAGCAGVSEQTCQALTSIRDECFKRRSAITRAATPPAFLPWSAPWCGKFHRAPGLESTPSSSSSSGVVPARPAIRTGRWHRTREPDWRRSNAQHRRYVQDMGVDARLVDLSLQVPHESIHYLSRDAVRH
jgi:hypothetical protein